MMTNKNIQHKSYKFRLSPNKEQIRRLNGFFGAKRFLYNHFLAKALESQKAGEKFPTKFDLTKQITQLKREDEYVWLGEYPVVSLRSATTDLSAAFSQFIKKLVKKKGGSKDKVGKLRFKKRGASRETCLVDIAKKQRHVLFDEFAKTVKISGITEPIKIRIHRPLPEDAKINRFVITKEKNGWYFLVVVFESLTKTLPKVGQDIGIDMGVIDSATLSNGEKLNVPQMTEREKFQHAVLARRVSSKKYGSKNHEKAKRRLAAFERKIKDRKNDYLNKQTTRLIREYDIIATEDLNIKGMTAKGRCYKKGINKAILAQGWYILKEKLAYKATWYDREMISIDRFYPSSQICSNCGFQQKHALNVRSWVCQECNTEHDRDVNAAVNILAKAKEIRIEKLNKLS